MLDSAWMADLICGLMSPAAPTGPPASRETETYSPLPGDEIFSLMAQEGDASFLVPAPLYKEQPGHWQQPHKAADCAKQTSSNKVPSGRVWAALSTERVDLVFVMGVGTGDPSLKRSKLISFLPQNNGLEKTETEAFMKMLAFLRMVHFGVAGWAHPSGQQHHPWLPPAAGVPGYTELHSVRMQVCVLWWLALGIVLGIPAGEGPLWDWT